MEFSIKNEQYLLHADLDAFFASVEQIDNPDLNGKPVVVGGSPLRRGVVAAASYEARELGAYSAMPMKSVLRLSNKIIRVEPRLERYKELSHIVMSVFKKVSDLVEPLSLDEAYIDISNVFDKEDKQRLSFQLKKTIFQETGLNITIGGGTSKTVAKIASQIAKPNGILLVEKEEEIPFMKPLKVNLLSGVGPVTLAVLKDHGISTIGELADSEYDWIVTQFGRRGVELRDRALGIDLRSIQLDRNAKSVSSENTMIEDVQDEDILQEILKREVLIVISKVKEKNLLIRTIKLKLRLDDFVTYTRQKSFNTPTNDIDLILERAAELLRKEIGDSRRFRLIGFGVSNFISETAIEEIAKGSHFQLKLNL